jgi:predicted MPP superfamily phosphohydrolase
MLRFVNSRFLLVFLSIALCAGLVFGSSPGGKRYWCIVRGPYLSSVTQDSVVVTWTTSYPNRSSIQYGDSFHYTRSVVDQNPSTIHSVSLTGLFSNKEYHYRIIAESDTTSDFTFWTAAEKGAPFVFAAYGDTRSNHVAHIGVLRQIEKSHPRFLLNTGDLVSRNSVSNWDNYFADLCDSTIVGQTIPVYACPGNHDSGTMYYENLFLPTNNPQNTEAYYSFDYGSVHIVSVNTEIEYGKESDQYRWLVRDLESPAAQSSTFKIVFWHRPPYSTSNHGSDAKVRDILCPLVESHGVDIVFSGHDHTYERVKLAHRTTYIVTGGGGAPLYDFKETQDWTAYKEKVHHFCKVIVEGNVLQMFMIRDDGSVRDSLAIYKNSSGSSKNQKE